MAAIYTGANSEAFAAMTTKGFEYSRDLARQVGMDLGMVVLGDEADNPPAAVLLEIPAGGRLPRHAHATHRLEVLVKGSIFTPDGTELLPGDVSVSGPGETYGPLIAGPNGCLTLEIFSEISGLPPLPDENDEQAAVANEIASISAQHAAKRKAEASAA